MVKIIVVIGATGTQGSSVIHLLGDAEWNIRASRETEKPAATLREESKWLRLPSKAMRSLWPPSKAVTPSSPSRLLEHQIPSDTKLSIINTAA
ncbi:hypothetical protein PROFUN_01314 [Planoprotostelium fungivorum]|uniref:Uncharacterized protein n=1 Tax=Planoprotostelium fungivorum TaxID=1890364 RepID=A0A2P6NZR7_9EUKA|nr:hypothetical protein PROFUN_01314 [Planoprotostelium fungivorum]